MEFNFRKVILFYLIIYMENKPDYLLLMIIGKKDIVENFINNIEKENISTTFVSTKLNYPISQKSLDLMKSLNNITDDNLINSTMQKTVIIDEGVEFAQGYICGNTEYSDDTYILQVLVDIEHYYLLSYLKFNIEEGNKPETLVDDWFSKKLQKNNNIKKQTKLTMMAGTTSNILIILVEIYY
jgi:hypothetical protein